MPIITHSDLDGVASALVVMELTGITSNRVHHFSYANYRDEQWEKLLGYQLKLSRKMMDDVEDVWFVDMSLRPGELEWARGKQTRGHWHWVDHHISSKDFDPDGIFDDVHLQIDGVCAADILYKMYEDGGGRYNPILESWVVAAHDRDLWIREDPELGLKLTLLIYRAVLTKSSWQNMLANAQVATPRLLLNIHNDMWEAGYEDYLSSVRIAQATAQTVKVGRYPVRLCYANGNPSDVAEEVYETGKEIIGMIQIHRDGLGINLRTRRKDISMAEIAKALFEGGGHDQAAGGSLDEKHIRGGYIAIQRSLRSILAPAKSKDTGTKIND